jgi:hypothetical protein
MLLISLKKESHLQSTTISTSGYNGDYTVLPGLSRLGVNIFENSTSLERINNRFQSPNP